MVCLETTFLIDLLRGTDAATRYMLALSESSESITVAAPTIVEAAIGAELAESSRERQHLKDLLKAVTVLPLDQESALLAGKLSAQLITSGDPIGPIDVMIAAIAATHHERLVTRNTKHFSRIPGLEIEDYTR